MRLILTITESDNGKNYETTKETLALSPRPTSLPNSSNSSQMKSTSNSKKPSTENINVTEPSKVASFPAPIKAPTPSATAIQSPQESFPKQQNQLDFQDTENLQEGKKWTQ